MKVINIRTLFKMSANKVSMLSKNMDLRFEDGIIIHGCYYKDIIVFRYLLDFVTKYEVLISSKLWLLNFYQNNFYSSNVHTDIYSLLLRDIVEPYLIKHGNNDIIDSLTRDMMQCICTLNRDLIGRIIQYSISLDAMDMIRIQMDNTIINELLAVKRDPSPLRIKESYNILDKAMRKPIYRGNAMVMLYLAKIASQGQMRQLFMSRGYITDLSNKIFRRPMTNSFMLGFYDIPDGLTESKAGAKALHLSGTSIQNTEYTNRLLGVAASSVENVWHGSCNNPKYTNFYVKDKQVDEHNNLLFNGALPNLVGKRYIDQNGIEKVISSKDTHLINSVIKIRHATGCSYHDEKTICSACIGEMADTINKDQNLAVFILTLLMVIFGQGMLSAKHLLNNAINATINISDKTKKFLMLKNNEELFFRANIVNKKTKRVLLKFKQSEAWGLDTILQVTDMFSINTARISKINEMELLVIDRHGEVETNVLPIKTNGGGAFLSIPFLRYIAINGFEVYDDEHYAVEVNNLDVKQSILRYDKIEYSLTTLNSEFKSMIKSQKFVSVDGVIRSEVTPDVLVQQLFDLLNSKLSVNIAIIEILVYIFTAKDITTGDFNLGRGAKYSNVVGFAQAMAGRSLGNTYNYDNMHGSVINPMMFFLSSASTPLDVLLMPNEVIKAIDNGEKY